MIREIKFRAFNKHWAMMTPPEDILAIYFDGVTAAVSDIKFNITTTDGQRNNNTWEDDGRGNLILMQFTGLKDRNGREIYEGDIVRMSGEVLVEVRWQPRGAWNIMRSGSYPIYEIIGNIYENPELLK
jgi:uncharacterized phage protein (TIGR01671 family)